MNYNKVIQAGYLTKDPEKKTLQNETVVTEFGIAVNEEYQGRQTTLYLDCYAFGRTAETIAKYFRKGSNILVEGRLVKNEWTNQSGQKMSQMRVNVYKFTFLDRAVQQDGEPDDKPENGVSGKDIPF